MPLPLNSTTVGHIPVIWIEPDPAVALTPRRLVIFLTGFSGSKASVVSHLERLAAAGFVALSFDPYQHGDRLLADREELTTRIHSNIRRYFWVILGETTRETSLVIDWAIRHLRVDDRVGMGGISMGGDISCAAAGVDPRIVAAACGVATPEWLRPGTSQVPGHPDSYALALYQRYNPLTHLDAYAHCPAITFQNGADDRMVPPGSSVEFVAALRATHYVACPERVEAILHAGVAHAYTDACFTNTLAWFQRWLGDDPGTAASANRPA